MPTPEPTFPDAQLIPPTEMLHDGSSSAEQFVLFGDSFLNVIIVPRARLLPTAAVLDMGCGNGSLARAFTRFLTPPGRYEGIDVNATTINWLQDRYRHLPNFRFAHADVSNKAYNPAGRVKANYTFPFPDQTFDLVVLKSVFTHMVPADVHHYFKEIGRVLKKGGRAVTTYFLLNDESRGLIARGRSFHKLVHDYQADPLCRVVDPEIPETVTAHDEQRIRGYCSEAGCSVSEIAFGDWCGRSSLLGHQDLVIAIRD